MGNWIEICKAGTWTAKNGSKVTLTKGDLDNIVASYDPTVREAPLVFGHPEDNHPAFGWAQKLKRSGEVLLAQFQKVPEAVKELVRAGHYKKVSISLGADKKALRHVGLLGAVQPAVPGLKDVTFKGGEDGLTIEFSNQINPSKTNLNQSKEDKEGDVEKKELEAKLAAEEEARKKAEAEAKASKDKADAAEKQLSESKLKAREGELETRVNKLVGQKILAKDKPMIKKIALALGDAGEEIEFSAGAGKKSLDDHLFNFLDGLPDLGLTTEFSDPGKSGQDASIDTSDMMTRI